MPDQPDTAATVKIAHTIKSTGFRFHIPRAECLDGQWEVPITIMVALEVEGVPMVFREELRLRRFFGSPA